MPINTSFHQALAPNVNFANPLPLSSSSANSEVNSNFSFGALLKSQLEQVNSAQLSAEKMAQDFEQDEQSVDIPQLMVAEQQALLSFNALVETRNKLVRAYQEIMQMQI